MTRFQRGNVITHHDSIQRDEKQKHYKMVSVRTPQRDLGALHGVC